MSRLMVVVFLLLSFSVISFASKSKKIKPNLGVKTDECVLEDLVTSGLGDVKYSILSETKFQEVNGDEWVLMKNQSKLELGINNEPSVFDYLVFEDNFYLNNLPDSRGIFLRSRDTRDIGNLNPDGDLKLGENQDQSFLSHNHDFISEGWPGNNVKAFGYRTGAGQYSTSNSFNQGGNASYIHQLVMNFTGGNETRPKNITVNTFIKIKQKCLDAVATAERRSAEARIEALEDYILKNQCDTCLTLPESDLATLRVKNECFQTEVDDFEAGTNDWNVSCQARTIGYAKKVLMLIGADNRTTLENDFLSHLDNQYPYYNVIENKKL